MGYEMTTPKATQARKRDEVNDMPYGSGRMMSEEASVNIGALQQRVYGLESGQRSMADSVSALSSKVETLFASLASKIEERSRPQYPLLISIGLFGLAVVSSVGWLAYAPIRENQTDLKQAMVEMSKAIGERVSIRELDGRAARTQADISRLNADLNSQDTNSRRSMEQADTNLQRQIDDMKKQFGDTFSLRDALLQMQRRIDQLEAARRSS